MKTYFILMVLVIFHFFTSSYGQDLKKLVPLESTCDDVKQILSVGKCEFPQSIYRLKDFTVVVNFTEEKTSDNKICYKVPPKTISSFTVSYNKSVLVKDFEYDLTLMGSLDNDIGSIAYENEKLGITVISGNSGIIDVVIYQANPENYRKYSYSCSKNKK